MGKEKEILVPVAVYKYQIDGVDNQEEIHVSKYNHLVHKNNIFCPVCSGILIYVNGTHRSQDGIRMHFRHKEAENKTPTTKREINDKDSLWHKWSQQIFPKRYREKVFHISNNNKIIADIMFDNKESIEFQNSKITEDNIKKRETNYPNMIWVVNGTRNKFYILGSGHYLMKMSVSNRWWLYLDINKLYVDTGFDGLGAIMKIIFIIKSGYVLLIKIGNYRDLLKHLNINDIDLGEIIINYTGDLLKDRLAIISKREKSSTDGIGSVNVLKCESSNKQLLISINDEKNSFFWKEHYFRKQDGIYIYDEDISYKTDISYDNKCNRRIEPYLFYNMNDQLIYSTGDYVSDLRNYARRNNIKLKKKYINNYNTDHCDLYRLKLDTYYNESTNNIKRKWEHDNNIPIKKLIQYIVYENINNTDDLIQHLQDINSVWYDFMLLPLLNYYKNKIMELVVEFLHDEIINDGIVLESIREAETVTFINLRYTQCRCMICGLIHYKRYPIIYFNRNDYKIIYKCNLRNIRVDVGKLF